MQKIGTIDGHSYIIGREKLWTRQTYVYFLHRSSAYHTNKPIFTFFCCCCSLNNEKMVIKKIRSKSMCLYLIHQIECGPHSECTKTSFFVNLILVTVFHVIYVCVRAYLSSEFEKGSGAKYIGLIGIIRSGCDACMIFCRLCFLNRRLLCTVPCTVLLCTVLQNIDCVQCVDSITVLTAYDARLHKTGQKRFILSQVCRLYTSIQSSFVRRHSLNF